MIQCPRAFGSAGAESLIRPVRLRFTAVARLDAQRVRSTAAPPRDSALRLSIIRKTGATVPECRTIAAMRRWKKEIRQLVEKYRLHPERFIPATLVSEFRELSISIRIEPYQIVRAIGDGRCSSPVELPGFPRAANAASITYEL